MNNHDNKMHSSKERPYQGRLIESHLSDIEKEIIKELTITNNNQQDLLQTVGNIVNHTKDHCYLITNINIKDKIQKNLLKTKEELNSNFTTDLVAIKDLFHYIKNEVDKSHILLDQNQSIIRNTIKKFPLIEKFAHLDKDLSGIKEFFNDIITTDWIKIGKPDEHGNKITKSKTGREYYINSRNEILIERKSCFYVNKYIIKAHDGTHGGCPYSIHSTDGELIMNRVEFCKKITEIEYFISVGPRRREHNKDKPSVVPSKITKTINSNDVVTLYVNTGYGQNTRNDKNDILEIVNKENYPERNEGIDTEK